MPWRYPLPKRVGGFAHDSVDTALLVGLKTVDVQEVDGEHERDAGQKDDDVAAQFLLLRAVGHHESDEDKRDQRDGVGLVQPQRDDGQDGGDDADHQELRTQTLAVEKDDEREKDERGSRIVLEQRHHDGDEDEGELREPHVTALVGGLALLHEFGQG